MTDRAQPAQTRPLTAGCLFAGMGGFCGGLKKAGIKTLWANELDPFAACTFSANYPGARMVEKDVCDLTVAGDELQPVDILTAGFPCQSFSCAGQRLGFDDERGKLFLQILRIVGEFGANKPKLILLENVPNLASGDGGKWLQEIITRTQLAGYWFDKDNCRVLKTDEISDLPQIRKRLFMAAASTGAFYCNDIEFPQPSESARPLSDFIDRQEKREVEDYLPPDNRYCRDIAAEMKKCGGDGLYQLRRSCGVRPYGKRCPTLTANMGGGGHNVPFIRDQWGIRRLTVAECAALQGFDGCVFPENVPDKERYRQIGNAVSLPVAEQLAASCRQFFESDSRRQERIAA